MSEDDEDEKAKVLKQVQFPEIEGSQLPSQNANKVTSCIYKRIVKLNAAHGNLSHMNIDSSKDAKTAKQLKEQPDVQRYLTVYAA